jgi:prephenate dehydrogenase
MNKELTEFTNNQLFAEILERVDQEATTLPILADLFNLIGKIVAENPHLYLSIIEEAKKRYQK